MPRRGGPKRARSDLDSGDSSDSDAGGQVQVKVARAGTAAAGAGEATADTGAARAASFAAMNRAGEEEAVAGTLLSVELWNFMVHVHFKLDLHKHANFVVGLNGSGGCAMPNSALAPSMFEGGFSGWRRSAAADFPLLLSTIVVKQLCAPLYSRERFIPVLHRQVICDGRGDGGPGQQACEGARRGVEPGPVRPQHVHTWSGGGGAGQLRCVTAPCGHCSRRISPRCTELLPHPPARRQGRLQARVLWPAHHCEANHLQVRGAGARCVPAGLRDPPTLTLHCTDLGGRSCV